MKKWKICDRGFPIATVEAVSASWALEVWRRELVAPSIYLTPPPRGPEEYEEEPFEGIDAVEVV